MNARTIYYLYKLRRSLHTKPAQLLEMQMKQLRLIIRYAYENVPFYHNKFKEAGVKPGEVRNIADLSKLPFTTKQEIQAASLLDVTSKNVSLNNCIKRTTSGSTGMPLTVVVDRARVDFEEALWLRTFFENGLRLRDKMADLTDPRNFPKKQSVFQKIGLMRSNYLSAFDKSENLATKVRNYRPDVIKGYPSSLELLARELGHTDYFKPRLIFTGAELFNKAERETINSISQNELFDHYSCSEFNLLAWECCEHAGYHINVESVLMESIRNEEIATPGERGELVCTNLSNFSMPLIRYKIGDVGSLSDEQCSCGRKLPLMTLIEGRKTEFMVTTDNRVISPLIFFPYPFESEEICQSITQFRVIQERRDRITIQLVAKKSVLDGKTLDKAEKEIKRVFGIDMDVNFEFVESISNDSSGKIKKLVS